jgi:hypothetical protein
MGFFHHGSDEHQAYEEVRLIPPPAFRMTFILPSQFQQSDNKAELSHEVISGAAAYEAMKAYEKHCEQNGKPQSHAEAKEILAGIAGAFIDREFETRGVRYVSFPVRDHN